MATTRKQLTETLTCAATDDGSWLSYNKAAGTFTVRDSFFYRHGKTAEDHAASVSKQLTAAGIQHTVLGCGEVWKSFNGGANIKAQSHWWVEVKV